MSRVIGVFNDEQLVNALVDDLKQLGLDRQDMIISSMGKEEGDMSMAIKGETDSITNNETFADINELQNSQGGLIVSVEVPAYKRGKIAEMMRQRGVMDIRWD